MIDSAVVIVNKPRIRRHFDMLWYKWRWCCGFDGCVACVGDTPWEAWSNHAALGALSRRLSPGAVLS